VVTALGAVKITRPWYLCPSCHPGQFPADWRREDSVVLVSRDAPDFPLDGRILSGAPHFFVIAN
jgi:hypothetical protein